MGTTQTTATLYQLQQIDLDLDRLTAEKQSLATSLQGSTVLRRLRAEYDTAQQQLQSSLQTQREAEWTLEDLTQRLGTQETRLYNGSVSNAKELQTLQLEVQRLRAQQSREEERLLEVIDAAEALAENTQKKAAQLKEAEDDWQHEHHNLLLRGEQVEQRWQELHAKRAELVADIPGNLVKRYDSMRRTKQGRAVSKVEQNSCQWCRVILTPSELQHVRISSEIQTCTNCGRILYYDR